MSQRPHIHLNTKILRSYEHKWVALSPDYKKVIASGDSLRETNAKLTNDTERADAVFYKVPSFDTYYVPIAA
jgi:hypothetical protein